jgi:hypothetical protein
VSGMLNGKDAEFEDWALHAGLMLLGVILIVTGFIIARRKRNIKKWIVKHRFIELFGVFSFLAGLAMAIRLVDDLFDDHINSIHSIFGIFSLVLLVITPIIGQSIFLAVKTKRFKKKVKSIRVTHRWIGRITITMVVLTIIIGLLRLVNLIELGFL